MSDASLEEHIRRMLPWLSAESVDELANAIERIVAALQPERIFVFGSQARGDATLESDIDLLVVVPLSDRPSYQCAQAAYEAVGWHTVPMDILVMTHEEFERRRKAPSSLPASVLREGRLLYAA